jgi:cell division protein FtsB
MPYTKHITHVFNPDGSHAGSAVFQAELVAGRIFDLDPRPIAADDADALSELIPGSLTAALAAVDARDATIAARDSTITTLTAERDAAQARVAELEAQLAIGSDQTHEAAVKAERDRRVLNGVKVGDDWFDTSLQTQIQYIGMLMQGAGLSAQTPLWTRDGRNVGATPQRVQAIFMGAAQLQAQLYSIAAAAIAADTPIDQIQWPETFTG